MKNNLYIYKYRVQLFWHKQLMYCNYVSFYTLKWGDTMNIKYILANLGTFHLSIFCKDSSLPKISNIFLKQQKTFFIIFMVLLKNRV